MRRIIWGDDNGLRNLLYCSEFCWLTFSAKSPRQIGIKEEYNLASMVNRCCGTPSKLPREGNLSSCSARMSHGVVSWSDLPEAACTRPYRLSLHCLSVATDGNPDRKIARLLVLWTSPVGRAVLGQRPNPRWRPADPEGLLAAEWRPVFLR